MICFGEASYEVSNPAHGFIPGMLIARHLWVEAFLPGCVFGPLWYRNSSRLWPGPECEMKGGVIVRRSVLFFDKIDIWRQTQNPLNAASKIDTVGWGLRWLSRPIIAYSLPKTQCKMRSLKLVISSSKSMMGIHDGLKYALKVCHLCSNFLVKI